MLVWHKKHAQIHNKSTDVDFLSHKMEAYSKSTLLFIIILISYIIFLSVKE
jgi:hypothetical protein